MYVYLRQGRRGARGLRKERPNNLGQSISSVPQIFGVWDKWASVVLIPKFGPKDEILNLDILINLFLVARL